MAQLNIYVTGELKERINTCKADISWSAVACEAIEQKLIELGDDDAELRSQRRLRRNWPEIRVRLLSLLKEIEELME